MAGIAEDSWKWMEMDRMAGNGWKWMEIALNY